MSKYIIGSVSSATMRSEDLIPVFLETLKELDKVLELDHSGVIQEGEDIIKREDWDSEDAIIYLNEDLWEALQDCAPPYFYFGSNPGDG